MIPFNADITSTDVSLLLDLASRELRTKYVQQEYVSLFFFFSILEFYRIFNALKNNFWVKTRSTFESCIAIAARYKFLSFLQQQSFVILVKLFHSFRLRNSRPGSNYENSLQVYLVGIQESEILWERNFSMGKYR